MAQSDSRRLAMVLPYLYPDLKNDASATADYSLRNDMDDTGTYLVWLNAEIAEPTEQELADAKEPAVNAWWWKLLRIKRDRLLKASDWSQGADVPSALKTSYATYRNDLRNLPTTVTKPDFETLNNQSIAEWNIDSLMPSKP
jgi:hypothetical protein